TNRPLGRPRDARADDGEPAGVASQANLVIPGLTFAEKDGLIVNFEGQVQRLRAAVHGRAVSEWKILVDLLASLGDGEAVEFVSHVRKAIGETEAAFAGVDLVNVGALGVASSGQPVG
ncbi:MAG: molybdopterin-dependent oxidoreductase, partial [Candidatus Krumholzibacteriota bacterium]|nr:molybdopterin-dependent oxidoreductase [Candidatus Krumholzibacteriota bacterium]